MEKYGKIGGSIILIVGNQIVPSSPLIREVKKEWNEGQCQLFHSNERRGETYILQVENQRLF